MHSQRQLCVDEINHAMGRMRDVFREYQQQLPMHAGIALRRQRPPTEAWIESAYELGLRAALRIAPERLSKFLGGNYAMGGLPHSIYQRMFLLEVRDSFPDAPNDMMNDLYEDERNLSFFYPHEPKAIKAIVFWMGLNDVRNFTICFENRCQFIDDYRQIRPAVEWSLRQNGLYESWRGSEAILTHDEPVLKIESIPVSARRVANIGRKDPRPYA